MPQNNTLMIAKPAEYTPGEPVFSTLWLSMEELWENHEQLVAAHDDVIWKAFNTHGKYMRKVSIARKIAIAIDEAGMYMGSAFVIDGVDKWLIENVMTNPTLQQKGVGSSVINRIMTEAKKKGITWAILNCDPNKNNGQLPAFYAKFGFKEVTV